jgi:hypothetical protein
MGTGRACHWLAGSGESRDAGRGLPTASSIATPYNAPVAQLDRVSASEAEGRGFESRRAHYPSQGLFRSLSRRREAMMIPKRARTF